MIRKTVAIAIFTASMFAVGCSSDDDDDGLPSNDDIAPIGVPDTGDEGTTVDDTSDSDGAAPVVTPETPTTGPGADDAATIDGAPELPTGDAEPTEGDTSDPDAVAVPPPPPGGSDSGDGSETTDAETDDDATDADGGSSAGNEPTLTAALGELDGNPESSRALITRQLLQGTEFGALLDGSEQPFTMFVPTDAAFISLGMSLEQLLDDPELANTVQFHIVQGETLDRATLNARSGQDLTMSNGQSNPLVQNGENVQIGSATISDAPDGGRVSNGVYYLIDQVLIPATGE